MLSTLVWPLLEIRPTDIVDMLLVAALVAMAIAWIRRTHAWRVATGIAILGLAALAVRGLGLQLTAWIFQGFFAIFLVVLVVIFQEELRQLFERLAMWGLPGAQRAPVRGDVTDVLVTCFADFARDRIGALVVLPGAQPIDRHVHGGIAIDGALSVPLLKSIFDHHSPGHDGAVVIERGKIDRFAVHLPLSRDTRQLGGVGTRHSAALGLAELTDALCLVASEERGRISVAERGVLRPLAGPDELTDVLARFLEAHRPASRRRAWWTVLGANWMEAVGSLLFVLTLWYFLVPGARLKEESFAVPVEVTNLPSDFRLKTVEPEQVTVILRGLAREFYLFDPSRLTITVDAALAKIGRRTFELSDETLRVARELEVELDPAVVKIDLERVPESVPAKE